MSKTLIVAELSANHAGSFQTAVDTIYAAKRAGADAIKLQTYTADTLTLDCDKPDFVIANGSLWDGRKYYDLYKDAYTPWEWHKDLFRIAREEGLIIFSTPFDKSAVDFLETLDNPIYKIASFEITDIPLIEYVASKMKPIVISIGIAQIEDIELAIQACRSVGNNDITLLKCTSSYPAPLEEANLCMIKDIADRFGVKSGLSDHTIGDLAPIVAVAQGAVMIEKHFIIDRTLGGPDAAFSMDEKEFTQMVKRIRMAETALGVVTYDLTEKQIANRCFSRSLYVAQDIKKGELITPSNLRSVRPGYGLHPKYLSQCIGHAVKCDLEKGTPFSLQYIDIDYAK